MERRPRSTRELDTRTTDAAVIAALAGTTLVLGTSIGCYVSVMTVCWGILTNEQA